MLRRLLRVPTGVIMGGNIVACLYNLHKHHPYLGLVNATAAAFLFWIMVND